MPFTSLTVVVTGGTGALGSAVAQLLAGEGARCIIPSHRAAEAPKFSGPGSIEVVPDVDLADEASVEKFYAGIASLWGSIHTAGGFAMSPIGKTSKAEVQKMLDTNAITAFLCCREAVKRIRAGGGGGRIVNVAAKPALQPVGGMIPYSMSKAAVTSLTQSLSEEVAGDGIWVNAVVPSVMDTPANRAAFPSGTDFSKWPSVADVAQTIAFLASPGNKVTRGALVPVYGKA